MVVLRWHGRVLLVEQLELPLQHLDLHAVPLSQLLDVASGVVHAYRIETVRGSFHREGGRDKYHGQTARSRNMAAVALISIFSTKQLMKQIGLTTSPRASSLLASAATGIRGSRRRGSYSLSLILMTGGKEGRGKEQTNRKETRRWEGKGQSRSSRETRGEQVPTRGRDRDI